MPPPGHPSYGRCVAPDEGADLIEGRRKMKVRTLLTAGLTSALLGFGAGTANASPAPSVNGTGMITLPAEYGDFAGDTVLFQLQTYAGATAGRFNVVHLDEEGLYARIVGDLTCVTVANGVTVTTGIARHVFIRDVPGASEAEGTAVAITVADRGTQDALGFDFEFFGSQIPPCGAVPPVIPLDQGDFVVG
jgi:hypothetical protein